MLGSHCVSECDADSLLCYNKLKNEMDKHVKPSLPINVAMSINGPMMSSNTGVKIQDPAATPAQVSPLMAQ